MTESVSNPRPGNADSRRFEVAVVVLGILVGALAITNQSYWIDELAAAYKASLPTLADWWGVISEGGSDLQQPLYPLLVRALPLSVSLNEIALRATNIIWLVIGLLVFTRATRGSKDFRRGFVVALLLSPFVWYYLNEARPYALQLGMSLVVFSALYRLSEGNLGPAEERRWFCLLCASAIVLAASGMLAMMWLGAYLAAAALSTAPARLLGLGRRNWAAGVVTVLLFGAVGTYYLWTLSIGTRATAVGGTDIKNLLFILFEMFGFSGLGPGRADIRTHGLSAFTRWAPLILIYGAAVFVIAAGGIQRLAKGFPRRTLVWWAACFAMVALVLLSVGVKVHFRVLGRHFTPMFPLVLLVLGAGLSALRSGKEWWRRVTLAVFVCLSLLSCGLLRFSERHAKDDYREAANLARKALEKGETVWWNAYDWGAFVYHVPLATRPDDRQKALLVVNPVKGFEQNLPSPDIIIASKPDIYDAFGELHNYLALHGFKQGSSLPAFSIWRAAGTH